MFFKKDYLIIFEACGKDNNYIGTGSCTYSKLFGLTKEDLQTIKDNCIASCKVQHVIKNVKDNLDKENGYYVKMYNEHLIHKNKPNNKIIGFKCGDNLTKIQKELLEITPEY